MEEEAKEPRTDADSTEKDAASDTDAAMTKPDAAPAADAEATTPDAAREPAEAGVTSPPAEAAAPAPSANKDAPSAPTERPRMRPVEACLFAFAVAAIGAVVGGIANKGQPRRAWIESIALDAGQHLAVGLVLGLAVASVAAAQRRLAPRAPRASRWLGAAATALASLLVTFTLVRGDLEGLALKARFLPLGDNARIALVTVAFALVVPAASLVASRLGFEALRARPPALRIGLPFATAAAGPALIAAHALLLDQNYPGLHLFGTLLGVAIMASALVGAPLPRVGTTPRRVLVALLAIPALWSTLLRPSDRAVVLAARRTTAVFATVVARAHAAARRGAVKNEGEWFRPRDNAPAIPPSSPPLVAEPVVILLTVDALRMDLFVPKHCKRLKNLCALRESSVSFENARSPANATTTSLSALFTGKYFSQLYWQDLPISNDQQRLFAHQDESPRFPQLLTDAGVHTFNALAHQGFKTGYGIVIGFETEQFEGEKAGQVVGRMLKNLETPGPLFMYAHLLEPHAPYTSKGKTPFDRYVGDVAMVDDALGKLQQGIAASPRASSVILMISADHGEGFNEHGMAFHGSTVYEEMVHVPMLIHGPGIKPAKITAPASLIDLGPTILDLFGLPTPGTFMGQTLVPYLRGQDYKPTRPVVVDSSRWQQAMIFDDGYKVIVDGRLGTVELYDLTADPAEHDDLAAANPTLADERAATLRAFFDAHLLRREGYEKPWRK